MLQRAASAPAQLSGSSGPIAVAAQTLTAPIEQAYNKAVLQAELAWVREQLDRERSRSNGAVHREQRRMMMELAHQSQAVSQLKSQVSKLERSLQQAQLTIAQQSKDMAVLGKAQALADWTCFASTRKRLLSSLEAVDAVTSRASRAERASQQAQYENAQLLRQVAQLKRDNEQLQSECHLRSSSEMHGPLPGYVA